MKKDEKRVKEYLEGSGYKKIVYEPDGSVPPDFLLDDKIAVEVRRLNKNIKTINKIESVEDLNLKLIPKVYKLLEEYKKSEFDRSAYIVLDFSRPLNPSKDIIKKIRLQLNKYINKVDNITKIEIDNHLSIELLPTSKKYESAFVLGLIDDNDLGGPVVSDVYENILLILQEKREKVEPFNQKYKTWWLALVDYVSHGLDDDDFLQLKTSKFDGYPFERILLIPSSGLGKVRELVFDKHQPL